MALLQCTGTRGLVQIGMVGWSLVFKQVGLRSVLTMTSCSQHLHMAYSVGLSRRSLQLEASSMAAGLSSQGCLKLCADSSD